MLLNRLASSVLASVVILGSIGTTVINPSTAVAKPSGDSTQLTAANIIATGTFVNVEQNHPTSGTARIINENGKRYLEFEQGFKTANGPEVKVILHRNNTVPVSVNEQDYVTLAALQSTSGAQRYAIPDDWNLDQFKAVAIWCKRFNVTFGYASL
ncbi:MAG: DM13 domain-containing protein [Symploca sp. SIO1C4]|uniref:DM13 domain-containing protein n=1 Tax=Symploca sp. SIO1C4 TaxID=2607765 RepID=A0A6B3NKA1_9CYAN|nr:DM13 domain-containing protein [Symploca sp. SIO1C4]